MAEAPGKMSNMDQAPEPTMDEILASIRRIISDEPTNKKGKAGPVDNQVALDIAKALSADDIIEPSVKMDTFNDQNAVLDDDILDLAEVATVAPQEPVTTAAAQGREFLQNFNPNQTQGIPLPHAADYAQKAQDMQRGPHIQNVPHQQPQPFGGMQPVQDREPGLPMPQMAPQMAPQIAPQMVYQDIPPHQNMPAQARQQMPQMQQMQPESAMVANHMQNAQNSGFMDPRREAVPMGMGLPLQQASPQAFSVPDAPRVNADRSNINQSFAPGSEGQSSQLARDFTAEIAQDMRVFQESAGASFSGADLDPGAEAINASENEAWIADNAEDGAGQENVFGAPSFSDVGQDFGKPKPFIRKAVQEDTASPKKDLQMQPSASSLPQETHKVDLTEAVNFTDDLQEDLSEDLAQASESSLHDASSFVESEKPLLDESEAQESLTDINPGEQQNEELTLPGQDQDNAVLEGETDQVFESHVKQMKEAVSEVVSEQVEQSFTQEVPSQVSHQSQNDHSGLSSMSSQSNSAQANPFEQGIKDMLKPMLKQWLDENMPRLVEGAMKDQMSKKD